MPRSRLKKVAKAVPAAKTKLPLAAKVAGSEQSQPKLAKDSDFTIGDSVSHPKFGSGTVTAIDGDKLAIEFAGKVTKRIVDYYVKRQKLRRSHAAFDNPPICDSIPAALTSSSVCRHPRAHLGSGSPAEENCKMEKHTKLTDFDRVGALAIAIIIVIVGTTIGLALVP